MNTSFKCDSCGITLPFVPKPPFRCRCSSETFGQKKDGLVRYTPPIDKVPTPTSDRLVIQIATGRKCGEELKISGPLVESYAEKCGADYVTVADHHFEPWPMASKWRVNRFAKEYHQTLLVDTDVMISDAAPDLFELTGEDRWGVFDELPSYLRNSSMKWLNRIITKVCESQMVDAKPMKRSLNGGIMVIPGRQADLYRVPDHPFPKDWLFDQAWLTQLLADQPVEWLSLDLYSSFIDGDFSTTWGQRPFVHFNGDHKHCHRLDLMRLWMAGRFELFSDPPDPFWKPSREVLDSV